MRELQSIIEHFHKFKAKGLKMALATVIHVENSSYRRTGAKMLITEDGQWTGGISGGCLEGDTLRKAKMTIINQKPYIVRYDTRDGDPNEIGSGLGCHGLIDVIISPLNLDIESNSISTLEQSILDRSEKILLTLLSGHMDIINLGQIYPSNYFTSLLENDLKHKIDSDISNVLNSKKSKIYSYKITGDKLKVFFEYFPPPVHLVICGRNYDAIPMAKIGKEIGWKISVVSNPLKVSQELSALADHIYPNIEQVVADNYTVFLLMSHDYNTDLNNFIKLSQVNPPFIGILGPSDRRDKILDKVNQNDIKHKIDNIFGPIGLDTGATTPGEIAISIIAEIRAHFSNRSGGHLRDRTSPINS